MIGGPCEGATVVVQQDKAGPHIEAEYSTWIHGQFESLGWMYEPQAPQGTSILTPCLYLKLICAMTPPQGRTQMCWTCTCSPPCLTATVPISRGSLTKRCLLTVFGIQSKVFGVTQCLLKLPGYVNEDQHYSSTCINPNPNPYPLY